MSKRPSLSKHPAEDVDLTDDEAAEKQNEAEENGDFEDQFDDTNRQGTSDRPDFMNGEVDYLEHHSEDMTMKDIFQRNKKLRSSVAGYIDHSQSRYYDRYKQQDYTRRNDYMKYCHVCRKKTTGKLRVLPGDLRMRKVWILRTNLDENRSAELWLRELACEGSHGGEFCEAHFPPGSQLLKGNQLMPLDVRPQDGRHSVLEDIQFDFEAIILQCVFCGRDGPLSSMLPFIRNRSKRCRWVDILAAGNMVHKHRLTNALRGGVTHFLCDFHIADSSFEINGFGEWRLLRNAVPDPRLVASDKRGERKYLVDKCRDEMFWEQHLWKSADLLSRMGVENDDDEMIAEDDMRQYLQHDEADDPDILPATEPTLRLNLQFESKVKTEQQRPTSSSSVPMMMKIDVPDDGVEYSDDSDEENELIEKMGDIPYSKRLCQVCSAVEPIGNDFPIEFPYKFTIRTWPFDEFRHRKWLEIMDWPPEFEESMKTLWQKRKTEGNLSENYHFCPINVCQAHLDFRQLPARMEQWHKSFCVLCDACLSDENLLVQLPHDLETRARWVDSLFPFEDSNKFHVKKVLWLRRRLLRPKPTRYRICVYHFSRKAFHIDEHNKILLNTNALPLSMDSDDFDLTPRGPNSVCKCILCDDWKKLEDMVPLRSPNSEAERAFLIDTLIHTEKTTVKKALSVLVRANRQALICNVHFVDGIDPFSVIAERRLMYGVQAECVLCAHVNDCTAMIPFPGTDEERLRTKWINAMCREPWIYRYLTNRLEKRGRHYLCASHFNRTSLRYHSGLGLWRRASACPVLACTTEEERQMVWDLSKSQPIYHPLVLEDVDSDGIAPLDYDEVRGSLGPERMNQIENELIVHNRSETLVRREKRKRTHDRAFYDEMPEIYEPEMIEEIVEEVEEEVEEVVQEDCIVYQEEHQLEGDDVEVVEEIVVGEDDEDGV